MRIIRAFLSGIMVMALAGLLAGCAQQQPPPLDLSGTRPSLLFFYTEN